MENTIILNSGEKIEVLLQDEVSLDIEYTLRYIQSGKKEIAAYVNETAKPQLDEVIYQAQSEMSVQMTEGINEAKAAAEAAAETTIANSIVSVEQEISSYVSQNITPDITAAVSAAENSKTDAASSATTAATAAAQAEISKTSAERAKSEAESAASLAVQKAEEAENVTEKVIPPLLSFQFTDHILNNASWLRADMFSWASGAVYVSAYEHLVADIANITAETETIGGYTVTFYRAADGHKICLADQETIVNNISTATGVAWYYILDTANQRFKLPRTKYGFVGLRDAVEKYVPESLPNIRGSITGGLQYPTGFSGSLYSQGVQSNKAPNADWGGTGVGFDASRSSSIYQDNAPVQQRATQMYLYFYVGETVQDANLINAGAVLDALDDKVDIDLNNCTKPYITETYVNGTSWYRVYSDGWCEQGGYIPAQAQNDDYPVTLLKPYIDTNYSLITNKQIVTTATGYIAAYSFRTRNKTTSGFTTAVDPNVSCYWQVCGYIS